ncbi:GNAT family N-acetyltransferase [Cohnella sp. GCM10012308]|uniref:GNAT family N-acetyltransferase n=1 Tax=Cohnella sp. GCM10012308 TaxID=3317329 RepID=UPI003621DA73
MNVHLESVTSSNFDQIIELKSGIEQEQRMQIYERWVGSNAFFLAVCQVYKFTPRAIYDSETLIGFACHGYNSETERFQLISVMLGHQFQGKGYATASLKLIIDDMNLQYKCKEIYLTVIHDNMNAIKAYEKIGFIPTGEIEKAFHDEHVYKLIL